jgi:hypothetical protein
MILNSGRFELNQPKTFTKAALNTTFLLQIDTSHLSASSSKQIATCPPSQNFYSCLLHPQDGTWGASLKYCATLEQWPACDSQATATDATTSNIACVA